MAKKKEETQKQMYGLFELGEDSGKLVSVYATEEEAKAELDKLHELIFKDDADDFYIEPVESQLDVEKEGYIEYVFTIFGVLAKTKKKKGGKKKKRPLKIFEDIGIKSDDDDATRVAKLAKAMSDIDENDYELNCIYETFAFNKKAKKDIRLKYYSKSHATVSIAIDGIKNRTSKEVREELFKRLGI